MQVGRRRLLLLPIQLMMVGLPDATEIAHVNLEYRAGRLRWSGGSAVAAVGRGGVRADKREGDGATPEGSYPLVFGLYRKDRVRPPPSRLPLRPLAPHDAWVDDPADPRYNRLVALPYPARTEKLWRDDNLYDLLVVIGYNVDTVIPGAGSAIFLHIARPNFAATEGCIAVAQRVLLDLIPLLSAQSTITIRS